MEIRSRSRLNEQISEEAAQWFIEFRSGDADAATRRQFEAWVRLSPEHLRAYLEYAALWKEADGIDAAGAIDVDELMAQAREAHNVVELEHGGSDLGHRPRAHSRLRRRPIAIAAAVLVMVMSGFAVLHFAITGGRMYATEVGEQRSIRLPDGSTVELNSRSRLRVRFGDETQRTVELLAGQALFDVAKDPSRPFVVRSAGTLVRAIGTRFDVNRRRAATIVTVIEGTVAVSDAAGSSSSIPEQRSPRTREPPTAVFVSAGQSVAIRSSTVPAPAPADVAAATAWTQRQLVLESAPLDAVAEEFNRYSERKIVVNDTASEPLQLSGVFATDPEFLLEYLRARPDITIVATEDTVRITHHDPR